MAAKGWRQFLLMIATLDSRPNSTVLVSRPNDAAISQCGRGFPDAWFATNPGKTRLRRIAADLESKGLAGAFMRRRRPPHAASMSCNTV